MSDLLAKIVAQPEQPFALLYRPDVSTEKLEVLQLLRGETHSLQEALSTKFTDSHEKLILVPFCQVARRGYQAVDDKTPILNMPVISRQWVPLPQALNLLPNTPIIVRDTHFNLDDIQFGQRVKNLVTHEIGEGLGSNFVLHRKLHTRLVDYHSAQLFSLYRRLLQTEVSAYWCFLISTGEQAFVGASPELQVSLRDGEVCMNPISGTFKYPKQGLMIDQLRQFLNNLKEINELHMVVDEELKVMSKLCALGAQVSDLHLKQLSQIIHTEYFLRGRTCFSVLDVLRETLPAPTVTGSPVQQACEVIARYEPEGRRYYSGVVALVDNSLESSKLDSAICIRTAEISADGKVEIGVGATIVRDSEPEKEAEETRIKAQALYTALTQDSTLLADKKTEVVPISEDLNNHRLIQPVLVRRNNNISQFWLANPQQRYQRQYPFAHKKILILDGNDTFTAMLQTLFSALGALLMLKRSRAGSICKDGT
ncbi:chorismate-binding protein [Bartonella queenslandensis]|uniref:chorismate-binding protein n=1 Tax=Bartonella queenslandensis TaxID=481138 RepID=UPI001BAC8542|nr:chorismate-binding protein [Bartonella queenslandensis]